MELKCTLQYSNPHVIRQIAVPEKITLQQLYRVICVCVDMDTPGFDTLFFKDGIQLKKTQQVDEIMLSESVPDSEKMLSCIVKKMIKYAGSGVLNLFQKKTDFLTKKQSNIQYYCVFREQILGMGEKK